MSTHVVQRCEIYLLRHEPCKEGPLHVRPVPQQTAYASRRRHFTRSPDNSIGNVLRSSVDLLVGLRASVGCWFGTAELFLPPSLPTQY